MEYNKYLDNFMDEIYEPFYSENIGGMKTPGMFILHVMLSEIKPDVVIESGVWKGQSTKLIRKTLGEDCEIICLDPRPIFGWQDDNDNTTYYTDSQFKDFSELNLKDYEDMKTLAFFDDGINNLTRLKNSYNNKIDYIIFNNNYPKNSGSHLTLEHVFNDDKRFGKLLNEYEKKTLNTIIEKYQIYPNVFSGQIKTGEGYFDCESYFDKYEKLYHERWSVFEEERESYRWNTLVKLQY